MVVARSKTIANTQILRRFPFSWPKFRLPILWLSMQVVGTIYEKPHFVFHGGLWKGIGEASQKHSGAPRQLNALLEQSIAVCLKHLRVTLRNPVENKSSPVIAC